MSPPYNKLQGRGNQARAAIMEAVRREPGVHKSALCRLLGMGWGALSYHLRVLRRQGEVRLWETDREVCLFPAGVAQGDLSRLAVLRGALAPSILERLRQEPGLQLHDLSSCLDRSRKVLHRHLTTMGDAGLVVKQGDYRPRYYLAHGAASLAARSGVEPSAPIAVEPDRDTV